MFELTQKKKQKYEKPRNGGDFRVSGIGKKILMKTKTKE